MQKTAPSAVLIYSAIGLKLSLKSILPVGQNSDIDKNIKAILLYQLKLVAVHRIQIFKCF